MKDKIETWVKSLQGKSRWELMYESTALHISDARILTADVYDDFLIFSKLDETLNATYLFQVSIDDFNEWSASYCADRIISQL